MTVKARRARHLLIPVAVLAVAIAGTSAGGADGRESRRPNVVVVMTDDQRVDDVRVMRSVRKQLVRRGVSFRNNFATYALCCPSRATFFTGQYAHNHGVLANEPPFGGEPRFRRTVKPRDTLPVRLDRAGYRTGLVGKYMNVYGDFDPLEVPPGWDSWHALVGTSTDRMYGYTLNDDGRLHQHGYGRRDYQTDVLSRKADRFVRQSATHHAPFFLELATLAPHAEAASAFASTRPHRNPRPAPRDLNSFADAPLPKPPSFNERRISDKPGFLRPRRLGKSARSDLRRLHRSRLESLQAVDDAVRHLIRTLRHTGELHNTVVLFTSDNGFLLGEHRQTGKELAYEESAGVPLIVRGPGFPRGMARYQVTGNIDLAPTIADLAGAGRRGMDGVSLLPVARDPGVRRGREILLERSRHEGKPFVGVRARGWVYVHWLVRGGVSELYDLRKDPYELRNITKESAYASVRHELRDRLAKLRDCAGKGCQ